MDTVYLDNAATSYPKPPAVAERMTEYTLNVGASINRSVYAAAHEAEEVTYALRERLCRLMSFPYPRGAVITPGNTAGLNMIIKGLLKEGDHCLVSSVEHNAVMRPLTQLRGRGVSFDRVPCGGDGIADADAVAGMIRPDTKLVIMTHASNVGGGIQDVEAVGRICEEKGVFFAVDAAQTAGHIKVDFTAARLAALSAPGHKGLMGPSGIGALLLRRDLAESLEPLIEGGTGSASDSEEQPDYMPDRFESGTANLPGIYGLEAALAFMESTGIDAVRGHDILLTARFLDGLDQIKSVRLVGPRDINKRVGVISVDFTEQDNAECAALLAEKYGILTRCGLHCAPAAHRALGTFPQGTVRFSIGYFNTERDIDAALRAVDGIARGRQS
ncbi:MAG: aminotransferase class V-fold PLP-dependent enzyme [Oscillospiraceae bacterium]|nr:aminotransferase class V-fold PLP-dependent enzyme [Oscillospiraceae bacterium]